MSFAPVKLTMSFVSIETGLGMLRDSLYWGFLAKEAKNFDTAVTRLMLWSWQHSKGVAAIRYEAGRLIEIKTNGDSLTIVGSVLTDKWTIIVAPVLESDYQQMLLKGWMPLAQVVLGTADGDEFVKAYLQGESPATGSDATQQFARRFTTIT